MTAQGRWMALAGLVGLFLGLLRGQTELALLSLTVLVWLAWEWTLFQWRLWVELPQLRIVRQVNGRADSTGILWAGRNVTITVEITIGSKHRADSATAATLSPSRNAFLLLRPTLHIRDVAPENIEILSRSDSGDHHLGNQFELRSSSSFVTFTYTARARAAGQVELPGVRLRLSDAQGFFLSERFIRHAQTFRVLPAFADAGDIHPLVKRINSLPQHGIHRLQRSGLGSELLELREYVPGDPPKAIAWKVSARRDKLMTRQYESEVPVRVQLFLCGTQGTRLGGYGLRLIDQMTYVAASVARAAVSVGDPVGAMLFDERGTTRLTPQGGERGFHRLLNALADFCVAPASTSRWLSNEMLRMALSLAAERYPELLDRRINQVPFTLWPWLPGSRRRFRERCLLAGVLAEVFQLDATQQVRLIQDSAYMAVQVQRFLNLSGAAWMEIDDDLFEWNAASEVERIDLLSDAMVKAVGHARDNEVFVVFADLLSSGAGLLRLLPAVKMALGRHHRVAFVCPSPTFRRPTASSIEPSSDSVTDLISAADQIRTRDHSVRLRRELRRLGATVTCSGEKEAIHLILSEMELARSGRLNTSGARS